MRRRAVLGSAAATVLTAGCSGLAIDSSHPSRNQDSRVLFVVLHYTVGNFETSLRQLTEGEVSSHYLVRDEPARIYRLVDEDRRAWHAGPSCWKAFCGLNASSVGIEIVNPGPQDGPQGRTWAPFPPAQMALVLPLVRQIVLRHQVRAERILGHNEIAPAHKEDPGPLFPWRRLAEEGLIAWPRRDEVMLARAVLRQRAPEGVPDIAWFQERLALHGFHLPREGRLDALTRRCLQMLQMRYRPRRCEGEPDAETAALLLALTSPDYQARAHQVPDGRGRPLQDAMYDGATDADWNALSPA